MGFESFVSSLSANLFPVLFFLLIGSTPVAPYKFLGVLALFISRPFYCNPKLNQHIPNGKSMESNVPRFLPGSSEFHPYYSRTKEDNGIIDLGLSLGTLQPETYHPSGQMISLDGYGELIDWRQSSCSGSRQKNPEIGDGIVAQEDCIEETDGVESKGRWIYVKVNMDGIVVGRKVCILDHGGYSTLAHQLEHMFGSQTVSGLSLFQAGSEFSLFYKDRDGTWRNAGDVPWKEFVETVKRLRITRRDDTQPLFLLPLN